MLSRGRYELIAQTSRDQGVEAAEKSSHWLDLLFFITRLITTSVHHLWKSKSQHTVHTNILHC
jgi:hypothetical protein